MERPHAVSLVQINFALLEVKTEPVFAYKLCIFDLGVIEGQNTTLFLKITAEQTKVFTSSFFPKYFPVWNITGVFYLLLVIYYLLKVGFIALLSFQDLVLYAASSSDRGTYDRGDGFRYLLHFVDTL